MSGRSDKSTVSRVIAYSLLLLAVAGVLGFVAYFTNGFTDDFQSFYVTVNGKTVLSSESGIEVAPDKPLTVGTRYVFGSVGKEISGYDFEILPAADFAFTVDGETRRFSSLTDLKEGFEIVREKTAFTLRPKGGVAQILNGIYPGHEIGFDKSDVPEDRDLFRVVVYSKDKTASVTLGCRFRNLFVDGVSLDQEVIAF